MANDVGRKVKKISAKIEKLEARIAKYKQRIKDLENPKPKKKK